MLGPLQQSQLHRNWHKTPFDLAVAHGFKALQGLAVLEVIGPDLLTTGGTYGAFGLFQTPFAKQRLTEPQHAVAMASVNIVEFFKSGLHGWRLCLRWAGASLCLQSLSLSIPSV